ncbi:hypothetical protein JW921_03655 [Candidatus Fermentibacterales bacterium]|nr:hypothetical protein [Candidatus Fermentibacterales bacterium]
MAGLPRQGGHHCLMGLEELADMLQVPACFGGKAAGLARLIGAGARVPAGFAVCACAGRPSSWDDSLMLEFRREAAAVLDSGPVIARSSAIGEDSRDRSFAGLFRSVPDLPDIESAMAAAVTCMDPAACVRVPGYAPGGVDDVRIGLVVQRMISTPPLSGVCFAEGPPGMDVVTVEMVRGCGASVVGGEVVPERWVVRTGDGADTDGQAAPGVARLAAELRVSMGDARPQDFEWAIDREGLLWWLQARPVTMPARPVVEWVVQRAFAGARDHPVPVWSNWNISETLPDPLTPLAWSLWRDEILPPVTRRLFGIPEGSPLEAHMRPIDLVNGRAYFNLNCMLSLPGVGRLVPSMVALMDRRAADSIGRAIEEGLVQPRQLPGNRLVRSARMIAAGARSLSRLSRGVLPARAMMTLERGSKRVRSRPPVATLSDGELLKELELLGADETRDLRDGLQMEIVAILVYRIALRLYARTPWAAELLAAGIPGNPTTEISLSLEDLTQKAKGLGQLLEADGAGLAGFRDRLGSTSHGREWLAELDGFLDAFGHRGPGEFDPGVPRWEDEPERIVELVVAGLRSPLAGGALRTRMERLYADRRSTLERAVRERCWLVRPLLRAAARMVERYMPLREAPKHHALRVFQRIRKAALELGGRLEDRSLLGRADDIFYLEKPEIAEVIRTGSLPGGLGHEIAVRRLRHEYFARNGAPPLVRGSGSPMEGCTPGTAVSAREPEEPRPHALPAGVELKGTPVSGGCVQGRVCIMSEPDAGRLQVGGILVAVYADPGWTPLFPRAAAVVMEGGGMLCHAAVVAREMGVPAVFGLKDATSLLHDGALVRVDGSAGTVTLLTPGDRAPSGPRS